MNKEERKKRFVQKLKDAKVEISKTGSAYRDIKSIVASLSEEKLEAIKQIRISSQKK